MTRKKKNPNRQSTPTEVQARRENAQHSTGPRTEMGMARVALNAIKHGYYADKAAYAAMVRLGEDPAEYARILAMLVEAHRPRNGHQLLTLELVALLYWQLNRNTRGQAALIEAARDDLRRKAQKKFKEYEETLGEVPPNQVSEHGIASLPPSPGKFQRITELLEYVKLMVKEGKYADAEETLDLIYGKGDPNLKVAGMRSRLWDLKGQSKGATAQQIKGWLLEDVEADWKQWHGAWKEGTGYRGQGTERRQFDPRGLFANEG